jgi:hypothetical protein
MTCICHSSFEGKSAARRTMPASDRNAPRTKLKAKYNQIFVGQYHTDYVPVTFGFSR